MTASNSNTLHASDPESNSDQFTPQEDLGWEGHVHFSEEVPLWKRILETWPELRTGLSYSLIFGSGVLLGGVIMAIVAASKEQHRRS